MTAFRLLLIPLSAVMSVAMAGCGDHQPTVVISGLPAPTVDQQHITFPANAPQLSAISTAVAESAAARRLMLGGRLAWDEEHTVRVYTPIGGRIASVAVSLGQAVKAGDELLVIDSPDFGQAQADLAKAAADLAQAEKTLARAQALFDHGANAAKDVEGAAADRTRAVAERDRCARRMELWNGRGEVLDQRFHLTAPVGGVVVERSASVGAEIRPDAQLANVPQLANPVLVITAPAQLTLWIDVPEAELGSLRVGMLVSVTTRAFAGRSFQAKVSAVVQALDPQTRVGRVKAIVDNPDGLLRAEQYVDAEVHVPSEARVQVPKRAAYLTSDGWRVFVRQGDGAFVRRSVAVGAEVGDHIEIIDGLVPGEQVVVVGALLLDDLMNGG